jgi:hypothetical protein
MIQVAIFAIALLLGSMCFFSFVMAPLVFSQLPPAVAGMFIRKVFPWFYATVAGLSLVAALAISFSLLAYHGMPLTGWLCLGVSATAVLCRQWLMHAINRKSDQMKADPANANTIKPTFDLLHNASVAINFAQLVAVAWVLYQLT